MSRSSESDRAGGPDLVELPKVVRFGGISPFGRVVRLALGLALLVAGGLIFWQFTFLIQIALLCLIVAWPLVRGALSPRWAEVSAEGVVLGERRRTAFEWDEIVAIQVLRQANLALLNLVVRDPSQVKIRETGLPNYCGNGYGFIVARVKGATGDEKEQALRAIAGDRYGPGVSGVRGDQSALTPSQRRRMVKPRAQIRAARWIFIAPHLFVGAVVLLVPTVFLYTWISSRWAEGMNVWVLVVLGAIFVVAPTLWGLYEIAKGLMHWRTQTLTVSASGVEIYSCRRTTHLDWRQIDRFGLWVREIVVIKRDSESWPSTRRVFGTPKRKRDGSVVLLRGAFDTGTEEIKDIIVTAAREAGRDDIELAIFDAAQVGPKPSFQRYK